MSGTAPCSYRSPIGRGHRMWKGCRDGRGAVRHGGDRIRASRPVGRVLPEAGGPALPHRGCERARGRLVAQPVRLAASVHPALGRPAAGLELSDQGRPVPDEGRDDRLPAGVRIQVRSARADGRPRRPDLARRRPVRPLNRSRADRGRQRDRGLGGRSRPADPRLLPGAGPRDRAAPLERVPEPVAAPRGRGPRRGRRQLRGRHLAGRRPVASDVALRPPPRARAGGHRPVVRAARGLPGHPVLRAPRADHPDADRAGRRR